MTITYAPKRMEFPCPKCGDTNHLITPLVEENRLVIRCDGCKSSRSIMLDDINKPDGQWMDRLIEAYILAGKVRGGDVILPAD